MKEEGEEPRGEVRSDEKEEEAAPKRGRKQRPSNPQSGKKCL